MIWPNSHSAAQPALLLSFLRGLEGAGPAAVGFDDLVDLGHDADGLAKGDDDLLVMLTCTSGDAPFGQGPSGNQFSGSCAKRSVASVLTFTSSQTKAHFRASGNIGL